MNDCNGGRVYCVSFFLSASQIFSTKRKKMARALALSSYPAGAHHPNLDGRSEAPPVRYLDNKIVRVHRRVVLRASRGGQCDGARYAAAPEGVWRVQDVSEEMRLRRADRREVLPLCPNWTPL